MSKLEITTKISRRTHVNGSAKGKSKSVFGNKDSNGRIDKVTLSKPSRAQASASRNKVIASEIRHDLVNKFRDVLQNGSYEVKANEIADKIVQKIRENKNKLVI